MFKSSSISPLSTSTTTVFVLSRRGRISSCVSIELGIVCDIVRSIESASTKVSCEGFLFDDRLFDDPDFMIDFGVGVFTVSVICGGSYDGGASSSISTLACMSSKNDKYYVIVMRVY